MSFAFVKLQRLVQSFDEIGSGAAPTEEGLRRAVRLVVQLGATALPLCVRELGGSDARRARWAEVLLGHLGARPELHARVVAELRELASGDRAAPEVEQAPGQEAPGTAPGQAPGPGDAARARARRMLAELGQRVSAPEPDEPYQVSHLGSHLSSLGSPLVSGLGGQGGIPLDAARLRADMARMSTQAEVAQVADLMLSALEPMALVLLVDELGESDPARALRLADEILLRNDLDTQTRQALRRVRAPLGMIGPAVRPARHGRPGAAVAPVVAPVAAPVVATTVAPGLAAGGSPATAGGPLAAALLGRHAAGRMVVIVSRPVIVRPGERPQRVRVMAMLLAADGMLNDGLYGEDFAARGLDRELLSPLRERGYRFATTTVAQAAELVREGARAALCLGRALPRAFYLGRDLLGLYDQHVAGLRATDEDGPLLDRGLQLLSENLASRARPLLERYVRRVPESAEGRAGLARCLLALGALEPARGQLIQAVALDPDNPLHHWNLAAIAHRQGRSGGYYLALLDYLDLVGEGAFDAGAGACDARLDTARAFVAEYERLAQIEYPEARAAAVARAEDLAYRAQQRLVEARPEANPRAHPRTTPRATPRTTIDASIDADSGARIDAAVALLEQAVALVPGFHPGWARLGLIFDERGRDADAERCLRRALALRPGDAAVIGALSRLERAAAARPGPRGASVSVNHLPDPGRG
ncbi:MAG TPA: tetratricopeptide repeat protein, partial [Haliangium sp.]|nr:tetratricopeptide repeat protein [Haliangium sp.]